MEYYLKITIFGYSSMEMLEMELHQKWEARAYQ